MKTVLSPMIEGKVALVWPVLAPSDDLPAGIDGAVRITSQTKRGPVSRTYRLSCHATRAADGSRTVDGYRLAEGGGKAYDVPASLTRCECPDALTRERPFGCKHQRALQALRRRGLLPSGTLPAEEPVV